MFSTKNGPIGFFDSGYGGLTILREVMKRLPEYDYLYLGDNARAPYGSRSFDVVYQYTKQAVHKLFEMGCPMVILACNTASAKALRSIQQNDLAKWDPTRRVLGIIRPTVEQVDSLTNTRHIGIFGTRGTINSESYTIEIGKFAPDVVVNGHPCPMWVPLVENEEYDSEGADFFVRKEIDAIMKQDPQIDTLILGCTHYPLLLKKIKKYVPDDVQVISQGNIVADSLKDYLMRHPDMEQRLTKHRQTSFYTTENPESFSRSAAVFLQNSGIEANHIDL